MMTGFKSARFRVAIGLIAAYAVALQTLFAAFAPLPANAQGADFAAWSAICFGSGNAGPASSGDPDSPAPASGKFHCVLCGPALAAAAMLPDPVAAPVLRPAAAIVVFTLVPDRLQAMHLVRAGSARAPPLTV